MKKKLCVITGGSGFTMIELIVTMAVFTILASVAIPVFSKWLPSYHLKTAARDVYSNIQMARLDAVKRNTACAVNIVGNTYTIGLNSPRTVLLDNYGKDISFGAGTTIASITFSSRGTATFNVGTSGIVTITNNISTYQLDINQLGTMSLKKL
jgi:prepilin-type N-terminal cleavage/methylation domain-containing protein